MDNYSFYNSLDFPLLTLILDLGKLKLKNFELEYYILSLLQQTIKNFEIILFFYYKNITNNSLIYNFTNLDRRINIYTSKNRNKIKNIFNIANIAKGNFILFIDTLIKFDDDELYNIYNSTKGKINNIFSWRTQNNYKIKLIRTKILRDIIDEEKNFINYNELINYVESIQNPKMIYISIALSPNDKYAPLAYNSMLSILISKNLYSYIDFFLIIPKTYSDKNYILMDSLFEQFYYFNITYIQMDERYQNAFVHRYITNQAYYRFSLGCLLPNLNKIIYLDADTICFRDLSRLYNLNFRGKMILGKGLNQNKTNKDQIHINSGILLLNLKKMRKMNIEQKVLNILNSGFKHPTLHDQAVIDTFFYKYVGLFPPEYNAYLLNYSETLKLISTTDIYNKDKLLFSLKYPVIRHYKGDRKNLNDDWFFFARRSKYFHEISNNYSKIFKYF